MQLMIDLQFMVCSIEFNYQPLYVFTYEHVICSKDFYCRSLVIDCVQVKD